MDNRGEFEAGPVEARPSVVYKRKSSPVVLVMMIVFALAAIGLGAALVMMLMNKPKSESVSANEEGGTISSAEATDAANGFSWHKNEDAILSLIDEMAESGHDYRIQNEYNIGGGATFEIRDGLLTSSFVSYGASITETASGEIDAMRSYAEKVLIKHGMKKVDDRDERDDGLNYIGDDGITCWISSTYWSLDHLGSFKYDCSDDSWITDEDKALDIALADAYNVSEQGKKYKLDYIFAQTRNIKKNAAGTYETIVASLSDAAGLFYRKVGGDWKFFTGAQVKVLPCEYYNNAELKEAYAGVKCYDNATKQDTVVK